MSLPTLTNPDWLSNSTREELEALVIQAAGLWLVNHKESGKHGDIRADSITVSDDAPNATGDLTVEGNAAIAGTVEVEGDVIAQFGTGSEVGLGELRSVNGTSLLLGEIIRQGVLIGGVTTGFFLEKRPAVSPFTSGDELALWSLGFSTTVPFARFGNLSGTMTLLNGGTGSVLDIGSVVGASPNTITAQSLITLGVFRGTHEVSPPQLTANQDNYAPTGHESAFAFLLTSDASRNITGLQGGISGRVILICNIGAFDVVLVPGSGLSTAANRFLCPNNLSLTLNPGDNAWAYYSGVSSRWRVVGV